MSDISNNNDSQKDILDNLLVKEETGGLHYAGDKLDSNLSTSTANVSQNNLTQDEVDSLDDLGLGQKVEPDKHQEAMVLAPNDDSFLHGNDNKGNAKEKSELVFHPEDKEQVARLAESVPVDDSKKYSVDKIIDKILSKQNLPLDDHNKGLLSNLILDFFRNRRSVIATRELLSAKITHEGKTLSEENVDAILSVTKSLKAKIDSEGGLVVNPADIKKTKQFEVEPVQKITETKEESQKESLPVKPLENEGGAGLVVPDDEQGDLVKDKKDESNPGTLSDDEDEEGQEESNIFLKKIQQLSGDDDIDKKEDNEAVPTVKFGEIPAGLDKDYEEGEDMIGQGQAEIEESLKEMQGIMSEMTLGGDDKEKQAEDKLVKSFATEAKLSPEKKQAEDNKEEPKTQEDLHDVGQLMIEEDIEKESAAEDDDTGFVIEKVKPEVPVAKLSDEDKKDPEPDKQAEDNKEELKTQEDSQEKKIPQLKEESLEEKPADNLEQDDQIDEDKDDDNQEEEDEPRASLPRVIRPGQSFSAKQTISDVQQAPGASVKPNKHVLTGPVEELGSMDLKSFRFLGQNAQERKNKVLEKINLLEQDSYTKKAAGIKAWRQSPVNKLYLNIGAESMTESKEISALINEKQKAGEEVLEMEEFSAISDLNRSLRF